MDPGIGMKRKTNPREKAYWLSLVTFFYNYAILKKGKKKDLQESDIYRVLPEFEAEKLGDRLEAQWKKDRKTGTKLWTTLTKCFGFTYLVYTLVQMILGTVVMIYQPKLFGKFVSYFIPNETIGIHTDAYLLAAAIGGFLLLNAVYLHNFNQLVTEYSMKIRTAVCSLVYRKVLRMSPQAFSDITIGKTVTLVSKDIYAIDAALAFIKDMIIGLLQLCVVTYILYERVGSAAFPPIGVIILIIPLQLLIGKIASKIRLQTANKTDERFRLTQEVLNSIRAIKTHTWQSYFKSLIGRARLMEISKLTVVYYLKALIGCLGAFTIDIAFYVLLVVYIAQGNTIEAETVYFVQLCLVSLKTTITVSIPMGICNTADLAAAFKRLQSFLEADEIAQPSPSNHVAPKVYLNKVKVAIKGKDILNSISIALDYGLLLITGNLGSGKSILLKTILGEYPVKSGHMEVNGTISYAPSEPWIFPSTIKQNIVFGQPYDPQRYQRVLRVCALSHDIAKLNNADETIVGDKGINLSKGQRARISLARTIYRDSDIYLLDDPISFLDRNHIFKCLKAFLKDKICIYATNETQMGYNNVLFLENGSTLTFEQQNGGLDKRITYFIDDDINFGYVSMHEDIVEENDESEAEEPLVAGEKNIYEEEKRAGSVQWSIYSTYYQLMGGIFVFIYLMVAFAAAQAAMSYSNKLISIWVNLEHTLAIYTGNNQTNSVDYQDALKTREYYVYLYTMLIIIAMVISIVRSFSTFYACLNAAKSLHDLLIDAVLRACLQFFHKHLIGNVMNRLSKDLYVIDEYLPFLMFDFFRLFFSFVGVVVLVASVNWLLLIPGAFLIIKLYFVQRLYLPAGRSLRRLEASSRSPAIGYLNSTLEGLSVIRASRQQGKLQSEFDRHQDLYTSAYYMNQTTMRFFLFIVDVFGAFFVTGIIFKLIFFTEGETAAGEVGLVITQSMMLSLILQNAIKQIAELENAMTSVERVIEYSSTTAARDAGRIIPGWPVKGNIHFENVSLSFQENKILNSINFSVNGGNKIGIVGRTGSGKTSIISSLFRLYDFAGKITIDNEDISSLSLDFLQSHITVIPQEPTLFSGTVRSNIDPFAKFNDDEIWSALKKLHIKHFISNLNQKVDSRKTTFSCGEKQLICLARAVMQQNKIIVLDEATANLDAETDIVLQKVLEECFQYCTVIIVAHKFHTVMGCDKVVALKDGNVEEFGEPGELLKNTSGWLYKMIRE